MRRRLYLQNAEGRLVVTVDKIRAGDESQDGQADRPDYSAIGAVPGG